LAIPCIQVFQLLSPEEKYKKVTSAMNLDWLRLFVIKGTQTSYHYYMYKTLCMDKEPPPYLQKTTLYHQPTHISKYDTLVFVDRLRFLVFPWTIFVQFWSSCTQIDVS
jgi:hypothetical protein